MQTDFAIVDQLLQSRLGLTLDAVLCNACLLGHVNAALNGTAKIMPRLLKSEYEEDGGEARLYEGVFVLDGIWYRFRCNLFIDQSGLQFLSDISQFEPVEWRVRMAV